MIHRYVFIASIICITFATYSMVHAYGAGHRKPSKHSKHKKTQLLSRQARQRMVHRSLNEKLLPAYKDSIKKHTH